MILKSFFLFLILLIVFSEHEEDYHTTPEEIDQEVGNFLYNPLFLSITQLKSLLPMVQQSV